MNPYYQENNISIYHGDCLEVMAGLAAETVDVVWTDPPYGHGNAEDDFLSRRAEIMGDGIATQQKSIANDRHTMRPTVSRMLVEAARVMRRDCSCCCCCAGGGGPSVDFAWLALRMDTKGLQFFHSCIWDKKNPGMGWRFRRQHEMVMVAHRRGGKLKWRDNDLAISNILTFYPPRDRLHPNEKPVDMVIRFLSAMASPGDTILDPFMGSGTTLVAAKALGLKAIGIEMEEEYCKTAVNRLRQEVLFG